MSTAMDRWLRRMSGVDRRRLVDLGDSVDAHHVGAETAEQHAAEGRGPEAAHHDDAGPGERPAHRFAHRSAPAAASSVAWVMTWLRFSSSIAADRSDASVFTWSARLVICDAERRVGRDLVRELERPLEQPVVVDQLADQPALVRLLGGDTVRPVSIQSAARLNPTMRGRK